MNIISLLKKMTIVATRFFLRRQRIAQFKIVVTLIQPGNARIVYETAGCGDQWKKSGDIYLSGFNTDSVLDIKNDWRHVIKNQLNEYQTTITEYETIRKFGEVVQLKRDYQICFKVQYKDIE